MIPLISYQEALKQATSFTKKHLLLGNGFSIACIPSIFIYSSLYEQADFSSMPQVKLLFEKLNTRDFELVINALNYGSIALHAYDEKDEATSNLMSDHSKRLKELLIETIAENHPEFPKEIEETKIEACSHFLSSFLNCGGRIYSLNYDLLLYWTLMYAYEKKLIEVEPNDGFGRDSSYDNGEVTYSNYITWQGESSAHSQNIHYLHGALHVFDKGAEIEKFTWIDTGKPLIEQTREALSQNRFPVFVAEGDSKKKMEKITHSGYLYHSYKSFSSIMKTSSKKTSVCLFTYGVSFSENDSHITKKISDGNVNHLFVGIYGDINSNSNKVIFEAVDKLKRKRRYGTLEVTYYDSASANVWGN
jgi:hypothetical protein